MVNNSKTDRIASTLLGKKIDGFKEYNPSILVAIPREENRTKYQIKNNSLPFKGWDIWHCYEFSAMTEHNLPITRVLKIKYPCDSEFIVESKSLKLYLNSFNMSRFGTTSNECLEICKNLISDDLSNTLNTNVEVNFLNSNTDKIEIFKNYENIMNYINEKDLHISEFKEAPELLQTKILKKSEEHYLRFDSLRSNCRVTHQPDFGDIFIYYKSQKLIDYNSLVIYLVSFRCEYHFHEECCEMIFKRLYDLLDKDDELFVGTLYTRRGGIDITPVRLSKKLNIEEVQKLTDLNKFCRNGIKQ